MKSWIKAALLVAFMSASAATVYARSAALEHERVLVAVADTPLPAGAVAAVLRTAGAEQPDLIVLSPGVSAVDAVGGAFTLLRRLRATSRVASQTQMLMVNGAMAKRRGESALRGRMRALADRAVRGERRALGPFGTGSVISLSRARF